MEKAIKDTNLINLSEASRRLGVAKVTIWRWIRDGKVTPIRLMGFPYLTIEQLETLKKR